MDFAVLGDIVKIKKISDGVGVIENIEKRKNYLSRKAGKLRGALKRGSRLEQIIAANIDRLFIITSIKSPEFNNRFLDRVIVAAESSNIEFIIVINKVDLEEKLSMEWEQFYQKIGYKVLRTSAIEGTNVSKLKNELDGKINIFWGQSGVGKSSLLNKMFSHFDFKIGEISNSTNKGVHTTVTGELKKVDKKTFIIDTPGIRELDPYGITKEALSHYFIEFVPYLHDCKFNTCIHDHEPECAIIKAVEEGNISTKRYQSYLNLLNTIEDDMIY